MIRKNSPGALSVGLYRVSCVYSVLVSVEHVVLTEGGEIDVVTEVAAHAEGSLHKRWSEHRTVRVP